MIRTVLVGGTGYGGMELFRLSLLHPELRITAVTSRTHKGAVADVHPALRGLTPLAFTDAPLDELAAEHDLVVFATPHGVAASEAAPLLARHPKLRVVDLSGDHRLRDAGEYETHYGKVHPHPEVLAQAVYGLPECGAREVVRKARLVANPGCHASATLLALWPFAREGLLARRAAVCSVTGSSGSGSAPGRGTHHPERFASFRAYKPLDHQHVPEIEQALRDVAADAPGIVVTQHLPGSFSEAFAKRLDGQSAMRVRLAGDRETIRNGNVYIAPGGDHHLAVHRNGADFICRLEARERVSGHRPSVDVLFDSVATKAGRNAVGVLLTGMGADGAAGLKAMRDSGAPTICQDEATSVVWGMPGFVAQHGLATDVLPLPEIAPAIGRFVLSRHRAPATVSVP